MTRALVYIGGRAVFTHAELLFKFHVDIVLWKRVRVNRGAMTNADFERFIGGVR